MTRRLIALAVAATATVAGLLVPAAPAAADVQPLASCYASSCHGKSPAATGCDADAVTKKSATSPEGIFVELRYSLICRSAWGRIRNGIPGDRVRVQRNDGADYPATITTGTTVYTLQVNDKDFESKACVRAKYTETLTCTGSY